MEKRVKSWDSFFEKHSMETTDAVEVNLETLNPETDLINEYEPELRVPMRNSIAGIQRWVDTGEPPCKVYVDESYNSDTISSLSESELSVPRSVPSPPLKYSSPHSPQPVNIPYEKLQRVSYVISSSSVNTREYILSDTQLTSKKLSLANMDSVIDSKRSSEGLFNIEDTYVDVSGTDERPKILKEETQVRAANSISNCQINELERSFILGEIFEKNLPDESAISRVTTANLKIGDITPSLQQIRDSSENYNCNHLYCDHLPSNESKDLIECRNTNSLTTPPPKIDEPVIKIKVRGLGRKKLFTNTQSPIDLIPPSSQFTRRFSVNTNFHPALAKYEVLQNQSKRKGKKSLFQSKKKLQDKRKNLKRNSSVTKSTNPRKSPRNNLQNSTTITNEKLSLETLEEKNSHLGNTKTNGSRKTEQIEAKKSPVFQTDSDFESSLEIFDFIPGRKKETEDKAISKIQTPPKNNLQNSAKLKTTTSTACDNNLEEKSDRDEKDDKENKDVNYEEATLNSFRNLDNTRSLKFRIISSQDSSDCDNNATFSRNKTKNLKQNSSKTKSTNPRRSRKKILQNSTKVTSDLETLEEENSQSNNNFQKLHKTQTNLSIKPKNKNSENNEINGNEKTEIMKTKKPFIFQRDSDSDSSLEMFDFMQRPRKEIKEKVSKIPVPSKKLQNNHFRKGNVQIAKKIKSPLKRSLMFNRKRKKSGFGGSISSDSEQNQSDLQFTDHQAESVGTFQNGENVIKVLPSKRPRREAKEMNLYPWTNIFGDDQNRSSSLTIFESSNDSSEDESNFLQNFNKRLKTRENTLNFDRKANDVKLQMFRTKLFCESDTD